MRGSIFYQTGLLSKIIFSKGAKKINRIDSSHEAYQTVASYNTLESYRKVWNNLGSYIKKLYNIKDLEHLRAEHIVEYMNSKSSEQISHQHLQKISSAIGKLEFALNQISSQFNKHHQYDFSCRIKIVKEAKKNNITNNNYRNRAYECPENVIALLLTKSHKLAARIQCFGGTRSEGMTLIKKEQLKGLMYDDITDITTGVIETKEKGGKVGLVRVKKDDYFLLKDHIIRNQYFKIDYRSYLCDIQNACNILGIRSEGSHGFRWNFAQRRIIELQNYGHTYESALQYTSYEMKHQRADITTHYCG